MGGGGSPLRGSSAAHTSLNFLSIKVDVRRVSGSSPLSSTIQKALKLQRFQGFRHFIQFVALAILPKFHKIVLKSPCCAIPLERHGRGDFSILPVPFVFLRFELVFQAV